MRSVVKGFVIYNKVEKNFEDLTEGFIEYLVDAFIYENRDDAEENMKTYDEPENYEIWEVEKVIRTI